MNLHDVSVIIMVMGVGVVIGGAWAFYYCLERDLPLVDLVAKFEIGGAVAVLIGAFLGALT